MFRKELKEAPLGYWEEQSYMMVILKNEDDNPLNGIFERVEQIDDLEILEKKQISIMEPGYIKLRYKDEEYEVHFFPREFTFFQYSILPNYYYFSDDDIEKLKSATKAFTIYMKFNKNAKKSFHLQLKLAVAMVPDFIGIMDESAEKLLPAGWVKMSTSTEVYPSSNDLYTVQAVTGKNGEVWLHTHGLCRCGLTELEILESDKENYNNHYNLISAFASFLLDKRDNTNLPEKGIYLGMLENRQPVVVTCISWTKGIKEYKRLKLGNLNDRKEGHNSKTSPIFIYKSEEDENNQKLSKVSIYNDLWGENPIFFISDEETSRMKALAIERFSYVKEEFKNKENKIIIKIGLQIQENDTENLEHIWFELLEIKGNKIKCKLIQEPYNVEDIHEGFEGWYKIDEITDWIIYEKEFKINPGNVYILDSMKKNK